MTELATRNDLNLTIDETIRVGEILAKSGFFSDTQKVSQAVAKILAGREIGFAPMASMAGIHIVKGKVTLSANLLAAAIRNHKRYDYVIRHLDDNQCKIAFVERHNDSVIELGESVFTMEDAQKAGLTKGDNWKKYPRNMLFARAMSNGAKWYCPDVVGGPVYAPDELGIEIAESNEVIEGHSRVVDLDTGEIVNSNNDDANDAEQPATLTATDNDEQQPTNGESEPANEPANDEDYEPYQPKKRDQPELLKSINHELALLHGLSNVYLYDDQGHLFGASKKIMGKGLPVVPSGQSEWDYDTFYGLHVQFVDYKIAQAMKDGVLEPIEQEEEAGDG